jgi:hypothetical protein
MSGWLSSALQWTKKMVSKTPTIKPDVDEALSSWQVVNSSKSKSIKYVKSRKSTHGKSRKKSKNGKQKKLQILPSIPEGDETKYGGRRTRKIRKNKL